MSAIDELIEAVETVLSEVWLLKQDARNPGIIYDYRPMLEKALRKVRAEQAKKGGAE